MSKIDKVKVTKTSLMNQEMSLDAMPSKRTKKAKSKERQEAARQLREHSAALIKKYRSEE